VSKRVSGAVSSVANAWTKANAKYNISTNVASTYNQIKVSLADIDHTLGLTKKLGSVGSMAVEKAAKLGDYAMSNTTVASAVTATQQVFGAVAVTFAAGVDEARVDISRHETAEKAAAEAKLAAEAANASVGVGLPPGMPEHDAGAAAPAAAPAATTPAAATPAAAAAAAPAAAASAAAAPQPAARAADAHDADKFGISDNIAEW
jgi:hypothetical protein